MKTKYYIILLSILIGLYSCQKNWLNAKPQKDLVVPSTLKDYQAILDNNNDIFNIHQPALGEISSGDFDISDNSWNALYTNQEKYAYIWAKDVYQGAQDVGDWDGSYNQVFNANVVLEGIENIMPGASQLSQWENLKGSALFYRAFAFYNISQVYAKPYNKTTANTDLGIPLRLESNVNEKSIRSTLQQTYDQVISDLLRAEPLLPILPLYKTRPSRPAVLALLARTYLSMGNYNKALLYADSCLQLNNKLLDYNFLDTSARYPVQLLNDEVIFHSGLLKYKIFSISDFNVDSALYRSYNINDLRRYVFFFNKNGNINYKGSYSQYLLFGGLATDEMYLIRAECYARNGEVASAMNDLNVLLQTRFKTGTFIPLTATSSDDALEKILTERRKELCFRGLRWTDLRRLNTDPHSAVTLTRILKGQTYTLLPNSEEYVFPIPEEVIRLSGIMQNNR